MLGVLAIVYSQDDPILWDSSLTEYEDIAPGTAQAHTELAYDFLSWFEKEFPNEIKSYLNKTNQKPIAAVTITAHNAPTITYDVSPDLITERDDEKTYFKWINEEDKQGHSIAVAWSEFAREKELFSTGTLATQFQVQVVTSKTETGEINYIARAIRKKSDSGPKDQDDFITVDIQGAEGQVSADNPMLDPIMKKKIRWVNPHIGLGGSAKVRFSPVNTAVYPSIDFSIFLSGYGISKHDQSIKFIGMIAGSGEKYGSLHFIPVAIRISEYTPNSYLFISGGSSIDYSNYNISPETGIGVNLGF